VNPAAAAAEAAVRAALIETGLPFDEPGPGQFAIALPGEHKLRTSVLLKVGDHSLAVQAFVARHPDEQADRLHRWLLERNAKLVGIAFAVDAAGDVYLVGRMPLAAVSAAEVDALLGRVLTAADEAFNPILSIGFAESIRAEWRWRLARGESTANLAAFEHLRPE
jgi:hypothetical protein